MSIDRLHGAKYLVTYIIEIIVKKAHFVTCPMQLKVSFMTILVIKIVKNDIFSRYQNSQK